VTQIIVLGAPESGLSVVARLLNLMGAHASETSESVGAANPPAAQEFLANREVVRLNDGLLKALRKSWIDCGELRLDAVPERDLARFRRGARALVASLDQHQPWVVNDPRLSLLLGLWKPFLSNPVCVLAHRAPAVVAKLLSLRHGLPKALCAALWEHYSVSALEQSAELPRTVVVYRQLLRNPRRTEEQLRHELSKLEVKGLEEPPENFANLLNGPDAASVELSPEQRDLARDIVNRLALEQAAPTVSSATATQLRGAVKAAQRQLEDQSKRVPGLALAEAERHRRFEETHALRAELAMLRDELECRPAAVEGHRSQGVFIVGSPRSGTSVLSWALARHPNFWTSAESDYLLELYGGGHLHEVYKRAFGRPDGGWLKRQNVSFEEFAAQMGLGAERLYDSRSKGRRWVDATPGHTLMIDDLMRLFPEARFLHILRDGRAVVNSMVSSDFDIDWASDFALACRTWVHYAQLGHEAARAHADRVLEVRQEQLVAEPHLELARVFEFLDEQSCERSVELLLTQRVNSSYGNLAVGDIRKAKDPGAAPPRPWRSWTAKQNRTFNAIAGDAARSFGYELPDGL